MLYSVYGKLCIFKSKNILLEKPVSLYNWFPDKKLNSSQKNTIPDYYYYLFMKNLYSCILI